jgi:CheY-like chemotaxis protein
MFNSQQLTLADSFSPHRIHTRHKQNGSKSKRRKPLVLVVDDERLIADTMTEILRRCGFHAVCAYEGKSALELARHNAPDFVLTDVVMPVMNGVELAIEIRKVLPDTEVILLSGQAGISDILSHGREKGYSFELFAKPVHPEKLLKRLKGE